jgi:hypothetical protein
VSIFMCFFHELLEHVSVLFFQVLPWIVTNAPTECMTYFSAPIRSKTRISRHLVPQERMSVLRCQSQVRNSNFKLGYMNWRKLTVTGLPSRLQDICVNIADRFKFQESQNRMQER